MSDIPSRLLSCLLAAIACAFYCIFPGRALAAEVDSFSITVGDMDRAVDFYTRALTFTKLSDREVAGEEYERLYGVFGLRVRCVRLQLGGEQIELQQFLTAGGRQIPIPSHSNDGWFQHIAIVVDDMPTAYSRLRSLHVEFGSSGPQRLPDWNKEAGGIEAFYFHDPDGHNLEVLAFPPGKGEARWHVHDRLFLGIDHSAIVVANTEASLGFYRDTLGLRIAGTSENYGTEQEHLNNVFGAHLRITTLRPARGPGVELLEYLAPRTGRAMPADTQPNDLWYWQINFRTTTPNEVRQSLLERRSGIPWTGTTSLHDAVLGWNEAFIAHDPDGHSTLIGH